MPDLEKDLRLAQGGDQQAFARLIDAHTIRLLLYIRRRAGTALRADFDAEDIFQQVVAKAWFLLSSFEQRHELSFHRWLIALADASVGDRVRYLGAKGREDVRHLESAGPSGTGAKLSVDPATSITSLVARREEADKVDRALKGLGPEDRHLLELHLLEGRSLSELATALKISKTTAWERLRTLLPTLRKLVESRRG
jgi:RNA polymerase sigma factor (sigma-70 family)